eukprot:NODE_2455_length_1197_cov_29.896341_g2240_i0.p1 GENE.NODE_2455_length_1197_cov_29.896341_g2240_i0~~NODE_2455_length_1197_cov_29.896341_g2240_i0.p1  ORF type:complete len:230 (+),score=38.69 NODE_2455_length_1197_cov_29.896341_g2240_i0:237-926(+)
MARPNLLPSPLPMTVDKESPYRDLALFQAIRPCRLDLFSLANYTFSMKDQQPEKDFSQTARLQRLKEKYDVEGMRRTVEGLLLVHQHNHPHVLLLQMGNNFFKLPGGRCKFDEDEVSCLKRKLTKKLSPPNQYAQPAWEVGDLLAVYWRPNFEQHLYPYLPPHITKPKESRKLFLVPLPEKCIFAVPRNYKLLAVPLFELFENTRRYGTIISSVPTALSRFEISCVGSN